MAPSEPCMGLTLLLSPPGETMSNRIRFFASGNGDSVLLEADGCTIMTDVHYRDAAADDADDDAPDFAPEILTASGSGKRIDLFVLTHPDQDHLRGFDDIFHTGDPDDRDSSPEEGAIKVIVDEIWCSEYAANLSSPPDEAKPLINEIKRRAKLRGAAREKAGNRLVVRDTDGDCSGTMGQESKISWRLLGPTKDDGAKAPDTDPGQESNTSSLVIRWAVDVDGKRNCILLGGDAPAAVWERLNDEHKSDREPLQWHVLLAPHHCSRYVFGAKDDEGTFIQSSSAQSALSQKLGDGFVVSSSKPVKRDGDDPPSYQARNTYYKILANDGDITDEVKKRFKCTGEEEDGSPGHVEFELKSKGGPKAMAGGGTSRRSSAIGGGGSYG